MTDAQRLKIYAEAYLTARLARAEALAAANEATAAYQAAEQSLVDAICGHPGEDGSAVVQGGYCIAIREEFWEQPAGERFTVHKLFKVSP